MDNRMCFCWYRGHLFVGPLSSINSPGLEQIEYSGISAAIAILSEGGIEISEEMARQMGWQLF